MTIVLQPATMTVQGMPPVAGTGAFTFPDSRWLGTYQSSAEAHRHHVLGPPSSRTLCGGCHVPFSSTVHEDRRLGIKGWCTACIAPHVSRCLALYGRLPTSRLVETFLGPPVVEFEEVYCPRHAHIVPKHDLVYPDGGAGRQRWICRPCRSAAVYQKQLEREKRERRCA